MSGGHWGHEQHRVSNLAEEIEDWVKDIEKPDGDWGSFAEYYSTEQIDNIKSVCAEAVVHLQRASILVQRLDYFISGDDGYESFVKRLSEELAEHISQTKNTSIGE